MPLLVVAIVLLSSAALLEFAVFTIHLRQLRTLATIDAPDPPTWPLVSVIVPARDEADTIGPALKTRLTDDYPELEIVIVDDRSTDGTAEVVLDVVAGDPRVRLLRIDELPDGWLGKVHALEVGAGASRGEFLLFSDADVYVERGALRRAVAVAEHDELGLLSLIPEYASASVGVEAAWTVFLRVMSLALPPAAVRNPSSKAALGSGAFNLVRRAALDETPGFEWLRLETADDMSLAVMLKQAGAHIEVMDGRGSALVSIYRDLGEFFRGVEKNGGTTAAHPVRFTLGILVFLATEYAPFVALAAGLARGSAALAAFGALTLAAATVTNMRSLHFNTGRWVPALLWPFGSLLFAAGTLRATWLVRARGGVVWRQTFHALDEIHDARRFEF